MHFFIQCCIPIAVLLIVLLLQFWLWGKNVYSMTQYYNILVVATAASFISTFLLLWTLHWNGNSQWRWPIMYPLAQAPSAVASVEPQGVVPPKTLSRSAEYQAAPF